MNAKGVTAGPAKILLIASDTDLAGGSAHAVKSALQSSFPARTMARFDNPAPALFELRQAPPIWYALEFFLSFKFCY